MLSFGILPVVAVAVAMFGLLTVVFGKTNVARQRGIGLLLTANFIMSISCFVHVIRMATHLGTQCNP